MTSRYRTYQQQSRKAVQAKQNESPKKQQPRSQHEYQFANLPAKAAINNVSRSSTIQPKLQIGEVGDKYEQEADRVAKATVEQINASDSQQVQRDILPQPEEELQMKPLAGKRVLQAKPISTISPLQTPKISLQAKGMGGEANPDLEDNINRAKSGGQSLAPELQGKIGRAMGADFSNVKIHTDSQSDRLNQSLQAKAFTTGNHVFFKQGEYNPGSTSGQELIAHELTHVVQQRGGVQTKIEDGAIVQRLFDSPEEKEKKTKDKVINQLFNSRVLREKGGTLKNLTIQDVVVPDKNSFKTEIKDSRLFDLFLLYCKDEWSDENPNALLLLNQTKNNSTRQMMAVAAQLCGRIDDTKYIGNLPKLNYKSGREPEDINAPYETLKLLQEAYEKADTAYQNTKIMSSQKQKTAKQEAKEDLSRALLKIRNAAFFTMTDTWNRFKGWEKSNEELHKVLSGCRDYWFGNQS